MSSREHMGGPIATRRSVVGLEQGGRTDLTGRRLAVGREGERLAADELMRRGYAILAQNWYCQAGEVDLVASRDGVLTFFEVRTRRGREYGTPEESVTVAKRHRMTEVAQHYLMEGDLVDGDWRLGLVAVEMDPDCHIVRLEVYESLE
jgi:putative endonuclease